MLIGAAGIRSVLPASRGTQKLWQTSADLQRQVDRPRHGRVARRDVQLVGRDEAEFLPVVFLVDVLPPPLMADDGDEERLRARRRRRRG